MQRDSRSTDFRSGAPEPFDLTELRASSGNVARMGLQMNVNGFGRQTNVGSICLQGAPGIYIDVAFTQTDTHIRSCVYTFIFVCIYMCLHMSV